MKSCPMLFQLYLYNGEADNKFLLHNYINIMILTSFNNYTPSNEVAERFNVLNCPRVNQSVSPLDGHFVSQFVNQSVSPFLSAYSYETD